MQSGCFVVFANPIVGGDFLGSSFALEERTTHSCPEVVCSFYDLFMTVASRCPGADAAQLVRKVFAFYYEHGIMSFNPCTSEASDWSCSEMKLCFSK